VGHAKNVSLPPYSPNVTPSDFFLWGKLKDVIYKNAPTTQSDMTIACTLISPDII
jgi:hypothetical protein